MMTSIGLHVHQMNLLKKVSVKQNMLVIGQICPRQGSMTCVAKLRWGQPKLMMCRGSWPGLKWFDSTKLGKLNKSAIIEASLLEFNCVQLFFTSLIKNQLLNTSFISHELPMRVGVLCIRALILIIIAELADKFEKLKLLSTWLSSIFLSPQLFSSSWSSLRFHTAPWSKRKVD